MTSQFWGDGTRFVNEISNWWLVRSRLEGVVSLSQASPNLDFWSDTSDMDLGAHLGDDVVSGRWSPQDVDLSIIARELLAVERGLHRFAPQVVDLTVAIFVDNSTAVAYLRSQEGTQSPLLNPIAQQILRWAESLPFVLAPQFIMGKNNALACSLQAQSTPGLGVDAQTGSLPGSMATLAGDDRPFRHLVESPMFLFFTLPRSECFGYRCSSSELRWLSGVYLSI